MPLRLVAMDEQDLIRLMSANGLTAQARPSWRCPTPEKVAAYVEQRLADGDRAQFEAHLADCGFCIGLVASLVRQQETQEPDEVPVRLVQQAMEAVPEKRAADFRWRWLLGPALAACVVVSAVLLRSPEPAKVVRQSVSAPAVAKTTPPIPAPMPQSLPQATPSVRSLTRASTPLQLLEPRPNSVVRGEGLRFRWKAAPDTSYYAIRLAASDGDLVWQGQTTDPVAMVPGNLLLPPGKYFVWVRAHLTDGRTLKSETVAFRIGTRG